MWQVDRYHTNKVLSNICESESCWSEQTIKWSFKAIKHVEIENQTSKQIESSCLKKRVLSNRSIKRHIFLNWCSSLILKNPNGVANLWTRIFHMHPTRSARLIFYLWKNSFEKSEMPLILFYFKKENKIKKKTLKKWLHSFSKSMSLKNPSLGPGIRLPIGKVPLKGSTPLSPIKVSTD